MFSYPMFTQNLNSKFSMLKKVLQETIWRDEHPQPVFWVWKPGYRQRIGGKGWKNLRRTHWFLPAFFLRASSKMSQIVGYCNNGQWDISGWFGAWMDYDFPYVGKPILGHTAASWWDPGRSLQRPRQPRQHLSASRGAEGHLTQPSGWKAKLRHEIFHIRDGFLLTCGV